MLTIHHTTEYRYRRPVAFGEHRIMTRPRDSHDLRVLSKRIDITPEPAAVRWIHDVFGNSVAIANFNVVADRLVFQSFVELDHDPVDEPALTQEHEAYFYPFRYDPEELPDLDPWIAPGYSDPDGELACWALGFLAEGVRTRTVDLLAAMTNGIHERFVYRQRYEEGTQHPLDTLQIGSGTCRDFALLMIEALRRLGIASRFVSGYLASPGDEPHAYVGGGSTHAWVQVYLPDAGWIEFDPTNGIVGNRDLIRVAMTRDPSQAVPLHGTYVGTPDDFVSMNVTVNVVSVAG